jgi:hypothetical protein
MPFNVLWKCNKEVIALSFLRNCNKNVILLNFFRMLWIIYDDKSIVIGTYIFNTNCRRWNLYSFIIFIWRTWTTYVVMIWFKISYRTLELVVINVLSLNVKVAW